jgi:hypothetical protein
MSLFVPQYVTFWQSISTESFFLTKYAKALDLSKPKKGKLFMNECIESKGGCIG